MRKHALLAGLVLLASPLTTQAQTFPTDDAVIKRIWAIGMDSSHLPKLAQALLDSVGPRLTASPGMKRANDWLVHTYGQWGVQAKNEQYGTWRGWRRGTSHIDLMSPRVRSLEGMMLAWSPGTGGKDVTAGLVILPLLKDSTEFARWLPAVKGKHVLISAAQPTCRPPEDWTQFATPESKAAMDSLKSRTGREWNARVAATGYTVSLGTGALGKRLEAAGAVGVITSRPKAGAWGTIEIFETYNTTAPGVAVSCEDYGLLYRLAENNQNPQVRMNLDASLLGEQPTYNTIATIRGSEKPNEIVMLSAHFDSWDGSSGATDNGTGTLVMMEAIRILKKVYPNPKRTIMVGHWASEEQGLNGSTAWTEDHPEVMAGLQALFNQDNGTGRIQNVGVAGLPDAGPHLASWVAKLPPELGLRFSGTVGGAPRGAGGTDGAVFTCKGTPSFGLSSLGWNYGNYTWHTQRDTYDKVVFDDVKKNATMVAMLVYAASEDPTFISRTKIEGEWGACPVAPRVTRAR